MAITVESRIYVTGATGFLGSYIVRRLIKSGYRRIVCLKRANSDMSLVSDFTHDVEWISGDILDPIFIEDSVKNIDVIINAASNVSFDSGNRKTLIKNASNAGANIVNSAMWAGVSKMIHISSVGSIGRRKKKELIGENIYFSHSEYDTTYGLQKFIEEQEVWRGHAEGLNVSVLCPSMILGAGDWHRSTPQLFNKIYNGQKFYPTGTNGWVDVRDVAEAVLCCLERDYNGERFIISAENVSYKDVFEKIAKALRVEKPYIKINSISGKIFKATDAVRSFFTRSPRLFTSETYKSTSVDSRYKNDKSVGVLGLEYRSIDDTINETAVLYKKSHDNGEESAILPF